MDLGFNELKKVVLGMTAPFFFIIILLLMLMTSAFTVSTADEFSSVKSILATEEGQQIYNDIWKSSLQEVYEETHVSVHLAWVFVPSCMIKDPYVITIDRAKEIIMLALDRIDDEYKETSLDIYLDRLLKEPEFLKLDREKVKELIERNVEESDLTTIGNLPKDMEKYRKLELSLPLKKWDVIVAEVGYYNPFGEWEMHYGMDIAVPEGTELFAPIDGTVVSTFYSDSGGNMLLIRNGTLVTIFCHMRELSLKKIGDKVESGELVGYSGQTGNVTGPHLHFETWCLEADDVMSGFQSGVQEKVFFNPRLLWDFN